jgi:hypothetical protein
MNNKNVFVEQILKISGIYGKNNQNFKTLRLIILIFLISLVIERSTLFNRKESYLNDIINSILFPNQISTKDFYQKIPHQLKNNSTLDQTISTIASVHKYNNDYVFRLKKVTSMNIYSPHVSLSKILQFLRHHSEKFPTKLLQIPDAEENPFELDLISILTCSSNFRLKRVDLSTTREVRKINIIKWRVLKF